MKAELHNETFELLCKVAEQYNIKFIEVTDFDNCIRVGSENFVSQTENAQFRYHIEITIFPGPGNFSENYFSVSKTTYLNEQIVDSIMDTVLDIPCTYITDEYYDNVCKRRKPLIPKDVFYRISSVLKEYKEKQNHVNLVMIHYYINFKVKV